MTDTTTAPAVETTVPAAVPAPVTPPVIPGAAVTPDPIVPSAPAPVPAPTEKAGKAEPYVYEKTGNANVDYALGVIGTAGINLDHPASQAALNGDFAQLRHVLAEKGVPGHESLVGMLEAAHKEGAAQDQANAKIIHEKVTGIFGTVEAWQEASKWAGEQASEDEKGALNELLSDTKTAHIAAHYIRSMFEGANAPREAVAPATSQVPSTATPSAPRNTPLSRQEFAVEAGKLRQTLGDAYTESPEYRALGARLAQ